MRYRLCTWWHGGAQGVLSASSGLAARGVQRGGDCCVHGMVRLRHCIYGSVALEGAGGDDWQLWGGPVARLGG
jgi:hypothetical protein